MRIACRMRRNITSTREGGDLLPCGKKAIYAKTYFGLSATVIAGNWNSVPGHNEYIWTENWNSGIGWIEHFAWDDNGYVQQIEDWPWVLYSGNLYLSLRWALAALFTDCWPDSYGHLAGNNRSACGDRRIDSLWKPYRAQIEFLESIKKAPWGRL